MSLDTSERERHPIAFFRLLIWTLKLVWSCQAWITLATLCLTLIQSLLPLASIWVGKLIIDELVALISSGNSPRTLIIYILVEFSFRVAETLSTRAKMLLEQLLGELLGNKIQIKILKKATELDLAHFENSQFYDKMQRAQQEAGYRPMQLLNQTFSLLQSLFSLIGMIILLIRFSWLLLPLLIIANLPDLIINVYFSKREYDLIFSQTQDQRRMGYYSHLLTSLLAFKEIKLYRLAPFFIQRYQKIFTKHYHDRKKLALKLQGAGIVLSTLSFLVYYGYYIVLVLKAVAGKFTIGDVTLYGNAFASSQSYLLGFVQSTNSIYEHGLFLRNLYEFLDIQPSLSPKRVSVNIPRKIKQGIVFENVSFKYPGMNRYAVENINCKIMPAETTAIVGENGAGKTTLIKLLCRFYLPNKGAIWVDGINLCDLDPQAWYEHIGAIFQDYLHYEMTVKENIGMGRIEHLEDSERIQRSAAKSGITSLIQDLPQGYDTVLGRIFDNSAQLSIGQWQKIALARAFMRDAPILILDEPTASLDVRSEYEIFNNLHIAAQNKLTVLISHRFTTVKMAQHIIVLDQGKISEQGDHDELCRQQGIYAQLYFMQTNMLLREKRIGSRFKREQKQPKA